MKKSYSRKDFLKLSAYSGLGIALYSCGVDEEKVAHIEKKTTLFKDTLSTKKQELLPKTNVQFITKKAKTYETLRKGYNLRINNYPDTIALCMNTSDVVEAVKFANTSNLKIAVRSGGHSMEGFSGNDNGMVINVSSMKTIEFLADDKVKVGPGCTLSYLYDHLLPKNLIIPAGSCGTVGVSGLTLGGGYGIFSRQYGMTCDHLLEATMVDGKGNIINTNDDPALLWALKGGGAGNFGIVTELIFQTQKAPKSIQEHHLKAYNLNTEKAKNLLQKWMEESQKLPSDCFSAYVLNGNTLTIVIINFGASSEAITEMADSLAPLCSKVKKGIEDINVAKKLRYHYGSLIPLYFKNSSAGFFNNYAELEENSTEIFNKIISTKGMLYQMNTFGGKINDESFAKNSSFPHRSYQFISELQAYWNHESQEEKLTQVSREILKSVEDAGFNAQYFNYCSRDFTNWEKAYYDSNFEKLQQIKSTYDPKNIIQHPQSINTN